MKIVLLQPPFFKLLGSHNDKVVPSLMFLGKALKLEGNDVSIVNADSSGASWYVPWKDLYKNFQYYVEAVEKGSPILVQTVEQVMSLNPKLVVVSAGCYLATTVDFGMPWPALWIVRMLEQYGVKVKTYGPFWDEGRFGLPSLRDETNIVFDYGIDVSLIPSGSKYDVVFTSVGCPYRCSFCLQPRYIESRRVLSDEAIATQLHLEQHYIEDPIFSPNPLIIPVLKGRKYTVEARVDRIDEKWIRWAQECGVRRVKIGVESGSKTFINKVNKKIDLDHVGVVIQALKQAKMSVVVYTMLGWEGITEAEYWDGLKFLKELEADYYVVNLTAPYGRHDRDWRFDTHFSPVVARYWGLSDALVFAYMALQEGKKNPTLL
jgi:hypothetical protein